MLNVEYRENNESEILEAYVSGDLDFKSATEFSANARKKAKEIGYMLLKEMKGITLQENILDALNYFDKSKNEFLDISNKSVIVAMVVNVQDKEFWDFWETVASNNGMVSKVFLSKEKATEWLKSEGLKKKKLKEKSE